MPPGVDPLQGLTFQHLSYALAPMAHTPVVIGKSRIGFHDFKCTRSQTLPSPETPICDDTCPPLKCYDCGTVAFQDFATSPVVISHHRESRNAEPRCTCELSPPRHRFLVALSGIAKSRFLMQRFRCMRKPRNAEPRLFQILGHVSLRSTAPTVSGNRGSRFHYARVSRLRNPDISNSDSPGSLATCPC
jgi:hypothetical protein